MNNFTKAVMMVLLGLSVIGTGLSAMDTPLDQGAFRGTRSRDAKTAAAMARTNKRISEQAAAEAVDLQDKVKAAKAKVATLEAKKAAKGANTVACHKRAWGFVSNAGYNVLNVVKYPFVTGYNYFTSDAKVAGKKKPAKKQESRFQRTVAFVKAIPSAVWSRLPNRYRAAWGTGVVAATGVAAVQVSPVAGLLVGSIAAGSAYKAYHAGDNKAKKAAPKAKDSKKK